MSRRNRVWAANDSGAIGIVARSARNCCSTTGALRRVVVDHDRPTGQVRGVLVVLARERVQRVAAVAPQVRLLRTRYDEQVQLTVADDRAQRVDTRCARGVDRAEEHEADPELVEQLLGTGGEARRRHTELGPRRHREHGRAPGIRGQGRRLRPGPPLDRPPGCGERSSISAAGDRARSVRPGSPRQLDERVELVVLHPVAGAVDDDVAGVGEPGRRARPGRRPSASSSPSR